MELNTNYTLINKDDLQREYLLNGDAIDTSGNGSDGTASNMTYSTSGVGYVTDHGDFNGTSSYITCPVYTWPADFCISMWVKTTSTASSIRLLNDRPATVYPFLRCSMNDDATGDIFFYVSINSSNRKAIYTDANTFNDGNRHNIVFYRNGSTMKIYVDSVDQATTIDSSAGNISTSTLTSSNPFLLGKYAQGSSNYFPGDMSGIRIYNKALTQSEINALYQEGLRRLGVVLPKDSAYTFYKYSLPNLQNGKILEISNSVVSGTYYDQSGSGYNSTALANVTDATNGQNNTMEFNGTSSYIQLPTISFGTEFSISARFNCDDYSLRRSIGGYRNDGTANWLFLRVETTGLLSFYTRGNTIVQNVSTTTISTGTRYNIIGTFKTNGTQKMYLNGVQEDSDATGTLDWSSLPIEIGRNDINNGDYFDGKIAQFQIRNRELSAEEVQQLYYSNLII